MDSFKALYMLGLNWEFENEVIDCQTLAVCFALRINNKEDKSQLPQEALAAQMCKQDKPT